MSAEVVLAARIDTGTASRVELRRGDRMVVSSPERGQGGDLSFLGFDQAMTRNINGWERFGRPWLVFHADPGMRLYDGEGWPVLEVSECRGQGRNDIMYPGCWREIYNDRRPGCRDLISAALGIPRAELTGMLSFFVRSSARDDAYMGLQGCTVEPGDYVSFSALADAVAAVSACPDEGIAGWRPAPLRVTVERV